MSNVEHDNFAQNSLYKVGSYGKRTPGESPQDIRQRGLRRIGGAVVSLGLAASIVVYGHLGAEMNEKYQSEFDQQVSDCIDQLAIDGAPEFIPITEEDAPVISGYPAAKVDHQTYCEQMVIDAMLKRDQY